MKMRTFILGVIAAAILQTAALGKILYDRASFLTSGQEVVLQSGMVDPRDLFRGHYVQLRLTVGTINESTIEVTGEPKYSEPVHVELKPGEDEFWVAKALYAEFPENADGPVITGKLVADGAITGETTRNFVISFPFDRYFADKERALELEDIRNDSKLGVVLAVGDDGQGAIKGISIDGKLIYSVPVL